MTLNDQERLVITRMTTGAGVIVSFESGRMESHVSLKDGRRVRVKIADVFVDGTSVYKHGKNKVPESVEITEQSIVIDGKTILSTTPVARKGPIRSASLRNFFESERAAAPTAIKALRRKPMRK